MKTVHGRKSAHHSGKTRRPRLLVSGDAQAEAVALILGKLDALTDRYDVLYAGRADASNPDLERCAFWLMQSVERAQEPTAVRRDCTRITFPKVYFRLLWPLAAPNPHNAPGKPADYPWGDSFISACVAQGLHPDDILFHYLARTWNPTWPNLDVLFKEETAALLAADAKCEVKIGSFILKNFRKRRLFWSPLAPSNDLLLELTYRLLHGCFGRQNVVERDDIAAALQSIAVRGIFASVALPVHPLVAEHFDLEWYDPNERVASAASAVNFREYYRDMIAYFTAQQAAAK